ncbi:MAG: glutamine cyclotransferase [Verrucomicrobiaceae bacterium]|nr:glutamine cyclotransferase [Verrucomicrobiaceae bacterium]
MRRLFLPVFLVLFALHAAATPSLSYNVIARYTHPDTPFTQGLELDGDIVYESSGLYTQSFIARWHLSDQKVFDKQNLPVTIFAEGLTLFNNRVYVLSWKEQKAAVFDKATLQKIGEFDYRGEGWGLTHSSQALIMSDGSDTLRVFDPEDFHGVKNIAVTDNGQPVERLNELEWIPARGKQPARILANIWQSDIIVVIDPDNGNVTAHLDLSKLYPKGQRSAHSDVLNGIAFDPRDNTLLITGKFWPYVFRVQLTEPLR